MDSIISSLYILIFVLLGVILLLAFYYFFALNKEEKENNDNKLITQNKNNTEAKRDQAYGKFTGDLNVESIYNFMEFDEIVDNMIIRKNGTQYIMILQCNGVNYDLMSEDEKISVEEGFVQFLNTLRFPIQLYIQSRTLNLKEITSEYKNRIDTLNQEIDKLDAKIEQARMQGNKALQEKLDFERRRKVNILEYGISITDYVEKLSSNRNILQQKTYVAVAFYSSELGTGLEKYSKEEIYNMCFSELYTRCQNIASSLANSQVSCSILDSEQLAELLYVAYNRDEAEFLQFSKALDAQYDALYSTGKDVLKKKQEKIKQEIDLAAIDLATNSILKADKERQIEEAISKEEKIKSKANELLDTYENQLHPRVYELAKENVNGKKKEKVSVDEEPKKKIVRKRKEEN